ncbi:MAG: rhodanese-like domain-containing protein [Bacteroidota bacterium]|jgi:rhodanese-related sulfurtransferase
MLLHLDEFQTWKKENKLFLLVDIRESYEVAICTLGGDHIPMENVLERFNDLPEDQPLVFHCNSGKRSDALVYFLEHKFKRNNLYSLEGGVQGYAEKFDKSIKCTL